MIPALCLHSKVGPAVSRSGDSPDPFVWHDFDPEQPGWSLAIASLFARSSRNGPPSSRRFRVPLRTLDDICWVMSLKRIELVGGGSERVPRCSAGSRKGRASQGRTKGSTGSAESWGRAVSLPGSAWPCVCGDAIHEMTTRQFLPIGSAVAREVRRGRPESWYRGVPIRGFRWPCVGSDVMQTATRRVRQRQPDGPQSDRAGPARTTTTE